MESPAINVYTLGNKYKYGTQLHTDRQTNGSTDNSSVTLVNPFKPLKKTCLQQKNVYLPQIIDCIIFFVQIINSFSNHEQIKLYTLYFIIDDES